MSHAPNTKRLTQAQLDEIARLAESGLYSGPIARRLGVSAGAVYYQMLRMGYMPVRRIIENPNCRGKFSPEEDARMLELAKGGTSVTRIARELGRAYTSTRLRLMLIEARAERAAA